MGHGFQLVFQVAEKPVVRQFDQARIVLGRSMVCDVVIDSPHLSRKHAEIVREPDGWYLQDLHSRHGLAVNGKAVERQRLADGDRIVLARDADAPTHLQFQLSKPSPRTLSDSPPTQAILSDESGPTSVVASIDLCELSKNLQAGQAARSTVELRAGEEVAKALEFPDAPMGNLFENLSQLPLLSMFKAAGEILLDHESLDDLLQRVVDLVAGHLPGRRGVACIVDQGSGQIEPRAFSREQEGGSREQGAGRQAASHASFPLPAPRSPLPASSPLPAFLISRSILQEAIRVQRAMLVVSAADDPRFDSAVSIRQMGIQSAVCVPLYHQGQIAGILYVDSPRDAGPLDSRDLEVLTVLGLMVAAGIAQLSLRGDVARERAIRDRLARYNSPHVVEQIMQLSPWQEDEMLAGEYDVSVLFADLTGFTTLAENWSAAEAVRTLNLVFERWTADVFQRDGTLDKYIGDAVMAIFGAPLRQADHAQRALATALAMQHTLDDLNRMRPGESPLQLRIGINSGRVIAGDIGSPRHKSYTVIGDVVNIASRLETSVALPGQMVIGQATYEQIREQYVCEPLGEIQLRGKRQAIRAYRVIGEIR